MNFAEYTKARRSKKFGIAVDDEQIARFVAQQPVACPNCGAQVFDPFGMGVVIHDVAQCIDRAAAKGRCAMTTLRVYISGPMTGRPNLNKPAFYAAANLLSESGHHPVNPAEVCAQIGATEWTDCMRADIKALCDCDAIALLPGWEMSQGAQLELHIAHRLGLAIGPLETYLARRPDDDGDACNERPAAIHSRAVEGIGNRAGEC